MPLWARYILWAAALATAISVLWVKVIRPFAHFVTLMSKTLPLLQVLTKTFEDHPDAFKILEDIASEFRTNDGSSLKDAVNRIEAAAEAAKMVAIDARAAADELKIGVKARELMAEQQRKELQDVILKLDRVAVLVQAGAASGTRLEQGAQVVADDLAAAHRRADATDGVAGTAADAAVQDSKEKKSGKVR